MARLAPCPDCKANISLAAVACPKCGRLIKQGDLTPATAQPMPIWQYILAALIVFLLVFLALKVSG